MLARHLPGVFLVLAVLSPVGALAQPADAETQAPLTLEWSAPSGCSSSGHILEEVATILGHSPAPGKAVAVRAVAEVDPRGHWGVSLVVEGRGEFGRRRFEAESCEAAAEAMALIVALMIEPTHLVGAPASPASPTPLPPAPAVAAETPASPGNTSVPPIAASPSPSPPTAARSSVPAASATRARPAPPSGLLGARISLGADVGTVSSANLGGDLAITTTLRHLRLEVAGTYWASTTATPAGHSGEGAGLELATLALRGAYLFTPLDKVNLGPLVGVEGDRVSAAGFGGVQHSDRTAIWAAVDFGAATSWWISQRFALSLALEGVAPTSRPSFVALTPPASTLMIQQASRVIFRSFFGVECRFL